MTQVSTRNLTSYDLFKAAAVLLMLCDHIGFYFFPDVVHHPAYHWFRAAGRLCVPIWFFLIGYAQSRDLSPRIWIGAFALVGAGMVAGMSVLPLNVLWSMIFIRLVLDRVMKMATRNLEDLLKICLLLAIFALPTYNLTEYGTEGLLIAMFGWMMRNRPVYKAVRDPRTVYWSFGLFTLVHFMLFQERTFLFPLLPMFFVLAGTMAVLTLLYHFRPREYPVLTAKTPAPARVAIQFLGRWTMEIYVGHLILFKLLGMIVEPERFQLLHWSVFWTPH